MQPENFFIVLAYLVPILAILGAGYLIVMFGYAVNAFIRGESVREAIQPMLDDF